VESSFVPGIWGRVNTAADEYHPTLRADQNRLYFVRQAINPPSDSQFYVADARCVLRPR
jgi:hypothetical protein